MKLLSTLRLELRSLAIFRALLEDPVVNALCGYLDAREAEDTATALSRYAAFVSALSTTNKRTLAGYIQHIVNDDENPCIRRIGAGVQVYPEMEENLCRELQILQRLADLTPEALRRGLSWEGYFPAFATKKVDLAQGYAQRRRNIHRQGYGIYAKYRMFYLDEAGKIQPVRSHDPVQLSDLVDYKREQEIILSNTLALLAGKPAANILLSGDAGTGKSSTVKAIVNRLWEQGLRILQLQKDQLRQMPALLDTLADNPLKFILFIDDLSFQKGDDNFSALKATLEGSVSARSRNVVIYATSNRRHLVKETFSDRQGDDVHRNDTMQELLSLSERFGIQVTFQKPDKATYLNIVTHLAQERGLPLDGLAAQAEQFALTRGGRSPRAARQFIDRLEAGKE